MKLAMNMLLWTDDITEPSRWPLLEQIAEAGYDGVEVPIFALDPERYRVLGERLAELELTALALPPPMPDAHPISPEADIRRAALERGRRALECAAAVGAELVAGPFQAAPTEFSGSAPTDQEREWAIGGVRALCEAAEPL